MEFPFYINTPVAFDEVTGLAENYPSLERRYSDMKGMYLDEEKRLSLEQEQNNIIYRFYDFKVPEKDSELAFGTSIVYP